jgi:hypothetical protein
MCRSGHDSRYPVPGSQAAEAAAAVAAALAIIYVGSSGYMQQQASVTSVSAATHSADNV